MRHTQLLVVALIAAGATLMGPGAAHADWYADGYWTGTLTIDAASYVGFNHDDAGTPANVRTWEEQAELTLLPPAPDSPEDYYPARLSARAVHTELDYCGDSGTVSSSLMRTRVATDTAEGLVRRTIELQRAGDQDPLKVRTMHVNEHPYFPGELGVPHQHVVETIGRCELTGPPELERYEFESTNATLLTWPWVGAGTGISPLFPLEDLHPDIDRVVGTTTWDASSDRPPDAPPPPYTINYTLTYDLTFIRSGAGARASIEVALEAAPGTNSAVAATVSGDLTGTLNGDGARISQTVPSGQPYAVAVTVPDDVIVQEVACDPGAVGNVAPTNSVATVAINATAGGVTSCTVVVNDLPQRYAPLVMLHRDEAHRPMSADTFLAHSDLGWSRERCLDERFDAWSPSDLGEGSIAWGPGPCGLGGPSHWFSTTDFTRPGDPRCTAETITDGRRCKDPALRDIEGFYLDLDNTHRTGASWDTIASGHVPAYYEYSPGKIVYWFLYGNSIPAKGAGWAISHEGDWEHVEVHLNHANEATGMTWYYHHWNSSTVPDAPSTWAEVPKEHDHPLVFAAREGHGSYWDGDRCDFNQPGATDFITRTFDVCDTDGVRWETWRNLRNAKTQPWYGFGGAWGQVGVLSAGVPAVQGNTTGPPGPGTPPQGCADCRERIISISTAPTVIQRGQQLLWRVAGWMPGTPVTITMFSDPVVLGRTTADAAGVASMMVTIPADTAPGEHEIQTVGNVAVGYDRVVRSPLTVHGVTGPGQNPSACPTDVPSAGFVDVARYMRQIDCLSWWKITLGTAQAGEYNPDGSVTRAQMASFIARAIEQSGGDLPVAGAAFADVQSGPHQQAIRKLVAAGVVNGYNDGTFKPNEPISRAQMAAFLVRAWEHRSGQPMDDAASSGLTDTAGNTHRTAIDRAVSAGWATGHADGTYRPSQPVRRDHMALFITRWLTTAVQDLNAPLPGSPG